jgi:hypothetical protein
MAAQPSWLDSLAPRSDPAGRPSRRAVTSQVCTARNVWCRCRDKFAHPGWGYIILAVIALAALGYITHQLGEQAPGDSEAEVLLRDRMGPGAR